MKKLIIGLVILIVVIACASGYLIYNYVPQGVLERAAGIEKLDNKSGKFYVYQSGSFIRSFENLEEAKEFAKGYTLSYITMKGSEKWVWDNYPSFAVYYGGEEYIFPTFMEAMIYAKGKENAKIANRANKAVIWSAGEMLPGKHIIEGVPLLSQNPELPRGCEVTSLAMLLNYYGIGVSKMDLAEQVKKNPTAYSEGKDGEITFGNPANGFVGDMYDMSKPGLGVYCGPLFELLKEYIGTDAVNLTGANFSDICYFLAKDKPVLVITTSVFKPLGNDKFEAWNTEDGKILITRFEHAVLLKGYDNEYIYFNNPLDAGGMQRVRATEFIDAWEQMGRQALTYFD